jgi:hypothetical protein
MQIQEDNFNKSISPMTASTMFITVPTDYFNEIKPFLIRVPIRLPESTDTVKANPDAYNYTKEEYLSYLDLLLTGNEYASTKKAKQGNNTIKTKKKLRKKLSKVNQREILEMCLSRIGTKSDISYSLGVSYNTVNNVMNRFANCTQRGVLSGSGAIATFDNQLMALFEEYVNQGNNNMQSISLMKQGFEKYMKEKYNKTLNYHAQTYRNTLTSKRKLNYSYKRMKKSAKKTIISEHYISNKLQYSYWFLSRIYDGFEIVYIDETGLSTKLQSNYGYSKRNQPLKNIDPPYRSKNYSLVSAITKDLMLGFMVFVGSMTGRDFYYFLSNLIMRYNGLSAGL